MADAPKARVLKSDEKSILQVLLHEVKSKAKKSDPDDVLRVIDEYCWKYATSTMNIGDAKGEIADKLFIDCSPVTAVELGSFAGYSTVRFARLLKPGAKLYAIEVNEPAVNTVREMVEYAGLSDKVTVIHGPSTEVIPTLREKFGIDTVDFLFLDHWKSLYRTDLMKVVECGLFKKGSVVVADNVLYPGAPEYADFIRSHPRFESSFFESHLEYRKDIPDGLEKSVYLG